MSNKDTKIKILDAAIELFWTSSYHATNMNALSEAAGLNKATVYQHFRSKEEIAVASVERALERTEEWVFGESFAKFSDPLERLQSIYDHIYQSHRALYETDGKMRGCPFVNIGMELAISSDRVRDAVNKAFSVFEGYYTKIVEDLLADGRLTHTVPTSQLAKDLQDNMNATLVASKLSKDPQTILDGAERAKRYLIG